MAARANIVLDQGTTFTTAIDLNDSLGNPIDLTEYDILAQIRKSPASLNAISFSATGNSAGIILLSMNSHTTSLLSAGRYVYDVLVTDFSGQATRVVEGQVTVSAAVSRS